MARRFITAKASGVPMRRRAKKRAMFTSRE
jgi:hypothetical protein